MTRWHYISPSVLPSRSANSVHVIHQCEGLASTGVEITLYARRADPDAQNLHAQIEGQYGVDTRKWNIVTYHSFSSWGISVRIALMSIGPILRAPRDEIVLSRNLYAAWLLATVGRPLLFETHQLEYGFRKAMQRWIMTRPWVRTVVISRCLLSYLEEHHETRLRNTLILHDAAPSGILKLAPESRRKTLASILKLKVADLEHWQMVCGYFGQLYAGRGIEIIEAMALARPACLFLVFGGDEAEVVRRREMASPNLRFMGHVSHPVSRSAQSAVDVLLMPYQHSVSIGVREHDTARWMSPMKMFEYLAAGVPIISSDLPVLREVLHDGQNCLLVRPSDPKSWVSALDRLTESPKFADSVGAFAHTQYQAQHTWTRRAERLIDSFKQL